MKVCVKVPLVFTSEPQMPLGVQPGLQAPEVVVCCPPAHIQLTVSPTLIVVVLVPLTESV